MDNPKSRQGVGEGEFPVSEISDPPKAESQETEGFLGAKRRFWVISVVFAIVGMVIALIGK